MKIEYFLVLLVSFTAPFILSFSKKMDFWKYPLRILLAIGIPFFIFIVWDIVATYRGHWSFNSLYVTGIKLMNLPLEEVLFFIVIPFCAIFTWESVKYFRKDKP